MSVSFFFFEIIDLSLPCSKEKFILKRYTDKNKSKINIAASYQFFKKIIKVHIDKRFPHTKDCLILFLCYPSSQVRGTLGFPRLEPETDRFGAVESSYSKRCLI